MKRNIFEFHPRELEEYFVELRIPPFKARQVCNYLYKKGALSFDSMHTVGKKTSSYLSGVLQIGNLKLKNTTADTDGSVKFLFETQEGVPVESVIMPDEDRITLCVSSQSGCPMGCAFCATGLMGFRRNLTCGEIVEQVYRGQVFSLNNYKERITNVVFMGMGEPMLNLNEVIRAVEIISSEQAFQISPRKITVSTIGIPGKMREFVQRSRANLAISLHAPDDDRRAVIMPSAVKMCSLKDLLSMLEDISLKVKRLITVEYLLIKNFNDSEEDAEKLANLLSPLRCKVNLIPYNDVPGLKWKPPSEKSVKKFQGILLSRGLLTTVRESKAKGINGACGQLGLSFVERNSIQLEGLINYK